MKENGKLIKIIGKIMWIKYDFFAWKQDGIKRIYYGQ